MSRRFLSSSAVTAALAAILLSGCAGDELTQSIRPSVADGELGPDGPFAAIMRVAESTAAAGDLAAAAGLYRRAHEMEPNRVEPLVKLGQTLSAMGSHEQAAEAFRTAIFQAESAPSATARPAPEAAHGLGNALVSMNQPKAALTQYEYAIVEREDPRTYGGIGVAYDMLGQHGAAQAYYRTGLETAPNNLNLLNNLGLSLAVTGKHDDAIDVLSRAVRQPDATSRTRLNLALAYGLAGRVEEAAGIARRDLDEPSVRSNLAFYETLRALTDPKAMLRAIGAHTSGFYVAPGRTKPATVRGDRARARPGAD